MFPVKKRKIQSPRAFLPRPLLRAGETEFQKTLAEFLRILFPRKYVSQKFVLFSEILKIGSNLVQ